jgi:drug/metabolite transporter (DMT)-like permease
VAYVLAVVAALMAAVTSVLQRMGVETAPPEASMSLGLVSHIVRRRIWLVGFILLLAQFGVQATALRFGQLSAVQPIGTLELLFLVAILALWFHRRLGWREWVGSAGVVSGLAGFLLLARPALGRSAPTGTGWVVVSVAAAVSVGTLVVAARTGPRWWRALAFGAAAAIVFAYNATLTKALTGLITRGWGHVFVSWVPYGLALTGVLGLFLLQNSLHAGPITASRAANVIVAPLVSIVIGVAALDERLRGGPLLVALEVVAVGVLCTGALLLAQSPLVAAADPSGGDERLGQAPDRFPFPVVPHPSRLDPSQPDYEAILALHRQAIEAGEAGYLDPSTGFFVQSAATLWARESCCDQGCRHCPYLDRPARSRPAGP